VLSTHLLVFRPCHVFLLPHETTHPLSETKRCVSFLFIKYDVCNLFQKIAVSGLIFFLYTGVQTFFLLLNIFKKFEHLR